MRSFVRGCLGKIWVWPFQIGIEVNLSTSQESRDFSYLLVDGDWDFVLDASALFSFVYHDYF